MARFRHDQWRGLVDARLRCRRGPDEVEGYLTGLADPAGDAPRRAWRLRVASDDYREIRPEDGWDIERVESRSGAPAR